MRSISVVGFSGDLLPRQATCCSRAADHGSVDPAEDLTDTDDEMRVAFRQMALAFAQLEKTRNAW